MVNVFSDRSCSLLYPDEIIKAASTTSGAGGHGQDTKTGPSTALTTGAATGAAIGAASGGAGIGAGAIGAIGAGGTVETSTMAPSMREIRPARYALDGTGRDGTGRDGRDIDGI